MNNNLRSLSAFIFISMSALAQNETSNRSNSIISATFTRFSGSMNVFGNLYSSSKPLQYNPNVNAITFVEKKSQTYAPSSNGNSGSVVMMINNNFTGWDSSCIWTNAINYAQVPQGGIYNPPLNTNLQNTYLIAMGPTNAGSVTTGNFYSSKLTGAVGNNTPGIDMQFFANTGTFSSTTSPAMKKHDNSRSSFYSTDDGAVRSLGALYNNINGSTEIIKRYRGAAIVKGIFTTGAMVWTMDSLIPPVVVKSNGAKQMSDQAYMAWNQSGTVGYVVFIGSRTGKVGSNVGWQPIVYKTTNSGASWALLNEINFNDLIGCSPVLNSIDPIISNPNIKVPNFYSEEGIDLVVDKCDNLHIASTIRGTKYSINDSLHVPHAYTLGVEVMSWKFGYYNFPYIYDFRCDNSNNWSVRKIDSCGSAGPSAIAGGPGYASNPWANQSQTFPVASGIRLQTSLSAGGDYIIYSWAESDTTLTTGATKWNEFPNVHTKAMRMCDGAISTDEYVVTSPGVGFNPRVRDKGYFHHISPICKLGTSSSTSATFTLPVIVSNNLTTDGSQPIDHFYSNVIVSFNFTNNACSSGCYSIAAINPTIFINSVASQNETIQDINTYPVPFKGELNLNLKIQKSGNLNIEIFDLIGLRVFSNEFEVSSGDNNIELKNMEQLKPGIYFIKLKLPEGDVIKKVIKEQ